MLPCYSESSHANVYTAAYPVARDSRFSCMLTLQLSRIKQASHDDVQGIHGQLLIRSLRGLQDSGPSLDAAVLPIAVREAAFVEAADCFAALIARPEVRYCSGSTVTRLSQTQLLSAARIWLLHIYSHDPRFFSSAGLIRRMWNIC